MNIAAAKEMYKEFCEKEILAIISTIDVGLHEAIKFKGFHAYYINLCDMYGYQYSYGERLIKHYTDAGFTVTMDNHIIKIEGWKNVS